MAGPDLNFVLTLDINETAQNYGFSVASVDNEGFLISNTTERQVIVTA